MGEFSRYRGQAPIRLPQGVEGLGPGRVRFDRWQGVEEVLRLAYDDGPFAPREGHPELDVPASAATAAGLQEADDRIGRGDVFEVFLREPGPRRVVEAAETLCEPRIQREVTWWPSADSSSARRCISGLRRYRAAR